MLYKHRPTSPFLSVQEGRGGHWLTVSNIAKAFMLLGAAAYIFMHVRSSCDNSKEYIPPLISDLDQLQGLMHEWESKVGKCQFGSSVSDCKLSLLAIFSIIEGGMKPGRLLAGSFSGLVLLSSPKFFSSALRGLQEKDEVANMWARSMLPQKCHGSA